MGRGFFVGAIWGVIVSGGALALASLLGEQPAGNRPPSPPQVEAPSGADATPTRLPDEPELDQAEVAGDPASAPQVTAPDAPTAPGVPDVSDSDDGAVADTASADRPQTANVDGALDAPEPAAAPDVAASADDPIFPAPQSVAPASPQGESDLTLSTEPAQPPAPEPAPETAFTDAAEAPEGDEAMAEDAMSEDAMSEDAMSEDAMTEDAMSEEVVEEAEPATEMADESASSEAPDTAQAEPEVIAEDPANAPEDEVIAAPEAEAAPEDADGTADAAEEAEPETVLTQDAPEAPEAEAETADVATALPQGDNSIVIRRPASDTEASATPEAEVADEAAEEVLEVAAVPDDAPALLKFGAGFEEPGGKPLMSVVLIDDGTVDGAVAALGGLPFPVTIALDPATAGAAEAASAYRAAGFEVMALAFIPDGAQPADVEVVLEATFSTIPEAIGMIDAGSGGLASGASTDQVMEALADEGRGFVTVSRGLNAALRVAEQAEVPATSIYRDLDADGQDARVIRRFLDQAAFRARQDSGVVMLGRVRPDTISALILWGTANRAGQVALVPVSAVLRDAE